MLLKKLILSEIRKTETGLQQLTDSELEHMIFRQPESLRLTLKGFVILRKIFNIYSFDIPDTIKSKHRIGMSKFDYPYYFTNKKLILFSELDATVIKLQGGIELFLENCKNSR